MALSRLLTAHKINKYIDPEQYRKICKGWSKKCVAVHFSANDVISFINFHLFERFFLTAWQTKLNFLRNMIKTLMIFQWRKENEQDDDDKKKCK